ncbi:hypothetical protein ARMGADRAFT_1064162 [Armillaria gallica]|uniref:Uncharacterized protein n=1 Tax=Armillaria gallica TaxID=47427 RepID=A0A2H3D8S0_ARMGA|nr:hypothetical protein ARMGADRAFT_1064162 [Armillaria gallica]
MFINSKDWWSGSTVHGNASLQTSSVGESGFVCQKQGTPTNRSLVRTGKCCYSRLRGNPTPRRLHNNRQATAAINTFGWHLEAANRTAGSRQAASSGQIGYLITYCQRTMAGSLGVVWCPAQTHEKYNLGCDSVKENTCKVAKGTLSCGTRLRCKA